ncbi:MAG: hypothetical protein ACMUJM_23030 [bacterium]
MKILYLTIALCFAISSNSYATIGVAEWRIVTPGGNIVSSSDPWKESHGTCLREREGNKVYVSEIIWWQYFEKKVIGKNKRGYFIFDEKNKKVKKIDTKSSLNKIIKGLKLGNPKSIKMTPADGWSLEWQYALAKTRLKDKNIDEGVKKRFQEILEIYEGRIYDDGTVLYFKNMGENLSMSQPKKGLEVCLYSFLFLIFLSGLLIYFYKSNVQKKLE